MSGVTLGEFLSYGGLGAGGFVAEKIYAGTAGEANRARKAQEKLEEDRRRQLANEAATREAAVARAATAGQRVGTGASVFAAGLGFGSGTTAPGLGGGALFGN